MLVLQKIIGKFTSLYGLLMNLKNDFLEVFCGYFVSGTLQVKIFKEPHKFLSYKKVSKDRGVRGAQILDILRRLNCTYT